MFRNYIIIALRNIFRQKAYSFINIFGFAIGLAVCLIISFYVIDDLTYDRFHEDAESIYHLLTVDNSESEGALSYSITAGPLVASMVENIPEILAATRITSFGGVDIARPGLETDVNEEDRMNALALVADSSFFDVFSFRIISGERERPLQNLRGVYLTPGIAETLFGEEEPVGKPLQMNQLPDAYVAGIIEPHPANSHLRYDIVLPLDLERNPVWWNSWENLALVGYFRTVPNSDPELVQTKLERFARERGLAEVFSPAMQPLLDVHLGSGHLRYDYVNYGRNDRMKVYTLGIIAILVLVIASINFINLSSARAARRAREVGLRKIIGGTRHQLFGQFLGESVLITLIAVIIALIIFEISLPYLNDFLQKQLTYNLLENYVFTLIILVVAMVVGILAGIYPALILSSFDPISVLSGKFNSSNRGIFLRRLLVMGQFAVSIALMISVFVVLDQINFLNRVDLGYNRENILVVRNQMGEQTHVALEELKKLPFVESVGSVSNLPGGTLVRLEVVPEGRSEDKGEMFDRLIVNNEFTETLGLTLLQGRNFTDEYPTDRDNAVIINETAANNLGWQNPLGKRLVLIDENEDRLVKTIIGVIKDMNFTTTRRKVNPMILIPMGEFIPRYLIKLSTEKPAFREQIRDIFVDIDPDVPFNSFYLDEVFNFQFRDDRSFAANIGVFSLLAILIACLGLVGLASFTTQQRKKEVALRKVMGASVRSVVVLLAIEFTRLVLISNLIAWPLAYLVMGEWLQNFVYRISINPLIFIGSAIIALIISFVTISAITIKAANTNPADIFQYE